jgi:multicomponent Na+:H+ antiporter subunit B
MMRSLILTKAVQGISPIAIIFSIYILLKGHNEPGGGFIAGLISSIAVFLLGLAHGVQQTRGMLMNFTRWSLGLGVWICVGSGMFALFQGRPFLTHSYDPSGFSTALLFDIGVYLIVIGVSLTILGCMSGKRP